MKRAFLALTATAVLVSASSAFAGDYITGKIGLYSPEEDDLLDNGFNIEAVYGMDISDMVGIQNMALELGIGYYTADGEYTLSQTIPFLGTTSIKTESDVSAIPVTATGIYTAHFNGPFSLYGGAGLGGYYIMQEVEVSNSLVGTIKTDEDEFKLGFHLVGGARYNLNELMDLVAELKYAAVSDDVGGLFVNVGLKYNF